MHIKAQLFCILILRYILDNRNSSGRYATQETEELKLPIKLGWRRETTVREYTKSGVRGEVCYFAPCGKKFKQYPDVVRVSNIVKFLSKLIKITKVILFP